MSVIKFPPNASSPHNEQLKEVIRLPFPTIAFLRNRTISVLSSELVHTLQADCGNIWQFTCFEITAHSYLAFAENVENIRKNMVQNFETLNYVDSMLIMRHLHAELKRCILKLAGLARQCGFKCDYHFYKE